MIMHNCDNCGASEEQGNCASCYGWGNHGYDDENNEIVCYACFGTGKYST